MDLLLYIATVLGSSGQCIAFSAPPHRLGAVGSGTPSGHRYSDVKQWAMGFLQYISTLRGSSGQWISFCSLPHCQGAVCIGWWPAPEWSGITGQGDVVSHHAVGRSSWGTLNGLL